MLTLRCSKFSGFQSEYHSRNFYYTALVRLNVDTFWYFWCSANTNWHQFLWCSHLLKSKNSFWWFFDSILWAGRTKRADKKLEAFREKVSSKLNLVSGQAYCALREQPDSTIWTNLWLENPQAAKQFLFVFVCKKLNFIRSLKRNQLSVASVNV